MLDEIQKNLLTLLLDQYERSKTYQGENKVSQTFDVRPSRIFPEYESDYADIGRNRDFENQMKDLEAKGLILIRKKGEVIWKLEANPEKWPDYYELLQRKDKRAREREEIAMYERYIGKGPVTTQFCKEQILRINSSKKAVYDRAEAEQIVKICQFIEGNREDILERELSIAVLGDSKLWENKYRTKVCSLLRSFGDFEDLLTGLDDKNSKDDKREAQRIILAEYHIFSNPSYVHFKGNGEFFFDDGRKLETASYLPVAFSTDTLKHLRSIHIQDKQVMTVENLTSFNRMERKNTFFVFLSGYHNSAKQQFLKKMNEENPGLEWRHFGDIDPDGFYIIEHLKRGTGIDFQPSFMDVSYLKAYEAYGKPLEENDVRKAKAMIKNGKYKEIMEYMLKSGKKLEQEIISWLECLEDGTAAGKS